MVLWMWSPYLVASVGLGFYLSRWPEVGIVHHDNLILIPHPPHHTCNIFHDQRGCWAGCVDIYGHSHQFWHVLIFLGEAQHHQDCDDDTYRLQL